MGIYGCKGIAPAIENQVEKNIGYIGAYRGYQEVELRIPSRVETMSAQYGPQPWDLIYVLCTPYVPWFLKVLLKGLRAPQEPITTLKFQNCWFLNPPLKP